MLWRPEERDICHRKGHSMRMDRKKVVESMRIDYFPSLRISLMLILDLVHSICCWRAKCPHLSLRVAFL